jgi:hypothetical protein
VIKPIGGREEERKKERSPKILFPPLQIIMIIHKD